MIAFIIISIGLILRWTYRPYIYGNNIFDFHIADTLGNIVAVPSGVHFTLFLFGDKFTYKELVFKAVNAFILYEGLAFWGTFDIYDIIATIISGLVTYYFMKFISKPIYIQLSRDTDNKQ